MDGAIIFFFVLATIIVAFTITALVSVSRATDALADEGDPKLGPVARFQQKLIDINKVPHPKGKGTLWTPSE